MLPYKNKTLQGRTSTSCETNAKKQIKPSITRPVIHNAIMPVRIETPHHLRFTVLPLSLLSLWIQHITRQIGWPVSGGLGGFRNLPSLGAQQQPQILRVTRALCPRLLDGFLQLPRQKARAERRHHWLCPPHPIAIPEAVITEPHI